jgi:alpha-galactosidase
MFEPAISITHADGNISTELLFQSAQEQKESDNVSLTTILLKDPVYQTEVKLFYKTYIQEDVIEQWTEIKNLEKGNHFTEICFGKLIPQCRKVLSDQLLWQLGTRNAS